jgi:hypothetical protein
MRYLGIQAITLKISLRLLLLINCTAWAVLVVKLRVEDDIIPLDRIDHLSNRLINRLSLFSLSPTLEGWCVNVLSKKVISNKKYMELDRVTDTGSILHIELVLFISGVNESDIKIPLKQITKDYSDMVVEKVPYASSFDSNKGAYSSLSSKGYILSNSSRKELGVNLANIPTPEPNQPSFNASAMFGYNIIQKNGKGSYLGEKVLGQISMNPAISSIEGILSKSNESIRCIWLSENIDGMLLVLSREARDVC